MKEEKLQVLTNDYLMVLEDYDITFTDNQKLLAENENLKKEIVTKTEDINNLRQEINMFMVEGIIVRLATANIERNVQRRVPFQIENMGPIIQLIPHPGQDQAEEFVLPVEDDGDTIGNHF